jgi:outer membrane receptor protein involved in Fe transport
MRRIRIFSGWLVVAVLGLASVASAQNVGIIRGVVTDAETGEPLPGVNVVVEGTYYGAATDLEGRFVIRRVKPGQYTLKISMIGYKVVKKTGVVVQQGKTTEVSIELESTVLALGQEVVVIGERPLFDIEETSSRRALSGREIAQQVVEDVKDIVATQVGVVEMDEGLHIRGGRAYENAYLIDGISVQDPLAGTGFGLQLTSDAIEEVEIITGGFNAEYGQAMSGVVNVTTKEGGDRYRGSISYKRDHFGDFDPDTPLVGVFSLKNPASWNTDVVEASINGPEPVTSVLLPALGLKVPKKLSFFGTIYGFASDDFTKRTAKQLYSSIFYGTKFAPRQDNLWSGMAKVTFRIDPTHKLAVAVNQSVAINQNTQMLQTTLNYVEPGPGYPYRFQENLDNFNTFTHYNNQVSLHWTHTLNSKSFYEVKLSRYFARLRADNNGKHWTEYEEPQDFVRPPLDYVVTPDSSIIVIPDGFYDSGNAFTWHDHYVEDWVLKADITSNVSDRHKMKAGIEATYREMQLIDIFAPWFGEMGLNNDIYKVYPNFGAAYIQDRITFKGLIANLGLRFDYWFPGKYVEDAINNPEIITISDANRRLFKERTYSFFGRRWKGRISPRIGVSHPISANQMLFFSYGHFSKLPKPQFVYAKLGVNTARSSFQRFGNPNLEPETTVAYELGLKNKFTENDVFTITAYYKDIFDYVTTISFRGTGRLANRNFITYLNLDYSRARGIEVEYRKRAGGFFTGSISGTYSIATGKSSTPDDAFLVARGDLVEKPITENFLIWDRPWQINANLNFFLAKGKGPRLLGIKMPDNWNLNVRIFAEAGRRYTPQYFTGDYAPNGKPIYTADLDHNGDPDDPYGKVGDYWSWVDVNFKKFYKVFGAEASFFLEIRNLLNRKNSNIINPVTGRAYQYGDPTPFGWNDPMYPDTQPPVSPFPLNPARYLQPRNVRAGLALRF